MKHLPLLLLLFLAMASPVRAQDRPKQQGDTPAGTIRKDASAPQQSVPAPQQSVPAPQQSVPGQHQESTREGEEQTGGRRGFVDEDGDGINDRIGQRNRGQARDGEGQRLRERRHDRFIDTDGDGIHDERGGGTGLRRGRRHGAAKGGGQ